MALDLEIGRVLAPHLLVQARKLNMATDTRIVVGVDDFDRAIAAVQVMGG